MTSRLRRNTTRDEPGLQERRAKGDHVLVLGTVSSTTIKATQVLVQTSSTGSEPSTPQRSSPSKRVQPKRQSRSVRSPPATARFRDDRQRNDSQQGDRSRVGGLSGGIVDRVVKLSNGEYEVHYIGVNWPHHVFVNQDFKVVGAN